MTLKNLHLVCRRNGGSAEMAPWWAPLSLTKVDTAHKPDTRHGEILPGFMATCSGKGEERKEQFSVGFGNANSFLKEEISDSRTSGLG